MNTSVMLEGGQTRDAPDALSTSVVHDDLLQRGQVIQGKYTVHGVLGHGGFGVVYDVEHLGLARRVALKVLHVRLDTPLALIERFRREARISALVHHPNVLEVYDTGTLADGSPYLVMERVNGENLSTVIARGLLPIAMTVEVGRQVAHALQALVDAGIVHRDVKPDNLMLHEPADGSPTIKLVDFGISKRISFEPEPRLTCHGALVGTPQYMAPEQIRGEEIDIRADIYALGGVLYEALTGHAPHESSNFSELVVSVLNSDVRPVRELRPNCPIELEQAILKALSRSRAQRFASPRELLDVLEEIACTYDLPRGADAFRTRDRLDAITLSGPRLTLAYARRWWPRRIRGSHALQLTLAGLLLGAQGSPTHGADEAQSSKQLVASAEAPSSAAARPAMMAATPPVEPSVAVDTPTASALSERLGSESALHEGTVRVAAVTAEIAASAAAAPSDDAAATSVAASSDRSERRKARSRRSQADRAVLPSLEPTTPSASTQLEPTPATTPEAAPPPARPESRAAWEREMQRALAAMVQGRLGTAREHYLRATQVDPTAPAGFRGLGLVCARLGDNAEARRALQRYLTLAPKAEDRATITARVATLTD